MIPSRYISLICELFYCSWYNTVMPLLVPKIQKDMEAAIMAALDTQMPEGVKADPTSHQKLAAAIAQGVTMVMVTALLTDAQVLPGAPTAGSPAAQVVTGPSKIF